MKVNQGMTGDIGGSRASRQRAWIGPLLLLTTIFFLNFLARLVFAPLMPEIEADLSIRHTAAGSLFFLMSGGYFIALVGSGWIAAALNHRRTIILSSAMLGLALVGTSFGGSLGSLRGALFLLGMAAGLYLPSGIATLTTLIDPKHWGKAIAIHELAPNFGFVVAPLLAELILVWLSWRAVVVMIGCAAMLMAVVFARGGRWGEFAGAAPGAAAFKDVLAAPGFWTMVVLFALAISSTLGLYTMLPLYLVNEQGVDRNVANGLVAASRLSGLFMSLLGGWAADRFGAARTMTVVLLLTGLATVLIGAAEGPWVLGAVFFQPLVAVCFFPAGFAVLSRIGPPQARNIVVSLTVPLSFMIGGGLVPTLIGFMGDEVSFGLGIALVGGCIMAGSALAHRLEAPPAASLD